MMRGGFLDHLLQAGRDLASQGQGLAERGLGVPAQGAERDAMLQGLGKGALVSGILGLLVGTETGREVGSTALTLGGVAALGTVAYKAYQNWQQSQAGTAAAAPADPGRPVNQLTGPAADQRSLALLRAMISAAKADGHLDDTERANIHQAITSLGLEAATVAALEREIDGPLDPAQIARGADSPEAAAEIYLASRVVIDPDTWQERAYLKELAQQLGLEQGLVDQLELQVRGSTA
jgi:uncharacterized membrane protein YebE (DUF533 family)